MMPEASAAPKLLQSGGLREFARLAAEAIAVGLFASLVLLVAALFISTAEAASPEAASTVRVLEPRAVIASSAAFIAVDAR